MTPPIKFTLLDYDVPATAETAEQYCVAVGELIDVEIECELPSKWVICSRCRGDGTHTNPSIDGHGISADEWHNEWDPDERETYLSGGYDVACEDRCQNGKVIVVDEDQCEHNPKLKALVERYFEKMADDETERLHDRRTRYAESGGTEGGWW